jgi:DNA mismatch endonuclease (patch repair protein)
MADVLSKSERSKLMAKIRGTNTGPEVLLRSILHRQGFRFRLHVRALPGKPDIVVRKYRAAIFVNGCFWHHHARCKKATLPLTRAAFWRKKILGNAARDRRTRAALRHLGWNVITVWQCQLVPTKIESCIAGVVAHLRKKMGLVKS